MSGAAKSVENAGFKMELKTVLCTEVFNFMDSRSMDAKFALHFNCDGKNLESKRPQKSFLPGFDPFS